MATFTGELLASAIAYDFGLTSIGGAPSIVGVGPLCDVEGGSFTDVVVSPTSDTFTGWLYETAWERFRERILIKYQYNDTGLVTEDLLITGWIWNTYLASDATLLDIAWFQGTGLSVSGIAVSDVLEATRSVVVTYTVLPAGPLTIDASVTYEFDLQSTTANFDGSRGAILMAYPQAGKGYAEARAFSTDLFRSENGTEFRTPRLPSGVSPNRRVRFPMSGFSQGELERIQNGLSFGLYSAVLVPLWWSLGTLTSGSDGSDTLSLVTTNREFEVGGYLVLLKADLSLGVSRQIVSFGASSVVVSVDVPSGWNAGDWVLPAIGATPDKRGMLRGTVPPNMAGTVEFIELR